MIKRIKSPHLRKRHRSENTFRYLGIGAISISFLFLAFLLFTIIGNGIGGFTSAKVRLDINFDQANVESRNFAKLIRDALDKKFPEVVEYEDKKELYSIISGGSKFTLQDMADADKKIVGTTKSLWLPAEEKVEIYLKKNADDWNERISDKQKVFLKILDKEDNVKVSFNTSFFTNGDSQEPELAGIASALIGSILTILSSIIIAIPFAVLAAVYLEEFASKNRFTDIIEVNINNLAAVPSIVYGLLGLAVYLNFFGMPRSASLVGGLTLALMVIPVIIIATRASLKAVPPSIRQAAMGIGASPLQVVMHHTVPLALPGIMTGTILGIARALGETAPLLMIGMVAFIADIPKGFTDPATAMPVQVFLWSKNNQPGFVEKTAAAIIILLLILILLNIIAVWIRKKYERRW